MREKRTGSDWTDPLRPDELTGARIRRAVREAAAPRLAERRRLSGSWWDVASSWGRVLSPVAAAVALVCAGLIAGRAPGGATPGEASRVASSQPVRLEDLVGQVPGDEVRSTLARDSLADLEVVFAAIQGGER